MNNNLIGLTAILLLTPSLATAAVSVPEPSTFALFGLAIAGIVASRLRKK